MTIRSRGWLTKPHSPQPAGLSGTRPTWTAEIPHSGLLIVTLVSRGAVRGVCHQHGPPADGRPLPALAAARQRLAGRLAADLWRRGHQLGRGAGPRGGGTRR